MISDFSNLDVVVVGSGLTGLVAALTAAEGQARVAVFEKQRSPGGTSNFLDGTFAVESRLQREQYITYSRDEAFKNIMEYSHWRADPRLVRAIVDESAGTIDWLMQQGVMFSTVGINMINSPQTYHVVKGQGAAAIKALTNKAKEKGINLQLETPVKRILKEDGRIAGVVVEHEGQEVTVRAKAVIIGSGGYANNKAWIKKYTGLELDVNAIAVGNVDKMGDGIRMAFEVGAADEGLGVLELNNVGPVGPGFNMKNAIELVAAQPQLLWVDTHGERICDESIAFYDTSMGNVGVKFKHGFFFRIFDDCLMEEILKKGIDKNVGMDNPPGTCPENLKNELDTALAAATEEVFSGDSPDVLAKKMGVDPAILKATLNEYNYYCRTGHDKLFAKGIQYLVPLEGPQYYAVRTRTVFLGTMGGIKINHRTEVLDKKGGRNSRSLRRRFRCRGNVR